MLALVLSLSASAQYRIDLQAGLSGPLGNAFEYSKNLGVGYMIDFMYVPGIVDDQLSFGIEKNGNLMLTASGDWKEKGVELKASKFGFTGAKARFELNTSNGCKPYGGIALGCGRLKSCYVYEKYNSDDESSVNPVDKNEFATGSIEKYRFCVRPEIGAAFGWFTMSVGWVIPAKFTDDKTGYELKAGVIQYNLGIRIPIN